MLTLRNNFHNTTCRVNVKPGEVLSYHQLRRARFHLCGIDGCTCSNETGTRGQQWQTDGSVVELVPVFQNGNNAPVFEVIEIAGPQEIT